MDNIISVDKLKEIVYDDDVLVFDCRPFGTYIAGHIPRAVNQELMHYHWFDTTKEGLLQFQFQTKKLLSFWGIKNKKVIFYDDFSGPSSSRGVWLLNYFSHKDVYLLDGGMKEWVLEGNKTETTSNSFQPLNLDNYSINDEIVANSSYVLSKIGSNSTIILDVRTKEEYDGKVTRASKGGHIPGSLNIDWKLNLQENKFKTFDDLGKLYDFPKEKEIITYCQGGYRAANTYIVLRNLGYSKVKMYLGSWGEWGNLNLPVE